MNNLRPRVLKSGAAEALRAATYNPRKLVLIHIGVSSLLNLALYAIQFWLGTQIDQTGGLSGIRNRALLETLQTVLMYANMILLPFWQLGFLRAAMDLNRGNEVTPSTLLSGFRRFGSLLMGKILFVMVLVAAVTAGSYAGALVFSMSPFAADFYASAEPYSTGLTMDYAAMMADEAVMNAMMPALPFILVCAAIPALLVYYRVRLMDYILLEDEKVGAFRALLLSFILTRKKGKRLLLLDLSFWWFYLLQLVIAAVCYGDLLLPMLNIDLGMSAEVALFVFYFIALALEIGLFVWKKPLVATTYARCYDELLPKETEENEEDPLT